MVNEENNSRCVICNNPTRFRSLGEGYDTTCSHVCGGLYHRKNLKEDDAKHSCFRGKVSTSVSRLWARRKETGEDKALSQKISDTVKEKIKHLNDQERKEKFSRYHICDIDTINRLNSIGRQILLDNHKQGKSGYQTNMKGRFQPKNPQKYAGDVTNIIYRSSWELKLLMHLDGHPDVLEYSSEEVVIPYRSPIDNKVHRYFVDFFVKKKNRDGKIESCLIEVKPKKQTVAPKVQNKATKRYITEVQTWGVNSAKWAAAREYCKDRGWNFYIFTEDHLGIK